MQFALPSLRIAHRRDVGRLGRQLGRAEDELQHVLEEVDAADLKARADRINAPHAGAKGQPRDASLGRSGGAPGGARAHHRAAHRA